MIAKKGQKSLNMQHCIPEAEKYFYVCKYTRKGDLTYTRLKNKHGTWKGKNIYKDEKNHIKWQAI